MILNQDMKIFSSHDGWVAICRLAMCRITICRHRKCRRQKVELQFVKRLCFQHYAQKTTKCQKKDAKFFGN